jgi:hypothetical protein
MGLNENFWIKSYDVDGMLKKLEQVPHPKMGKPGLKQNSINYRACS